MHYLLRKQLRIVYSFVMRNQASLVSLNSRWRYYTISVQCQPTARERRALESEFICNDEWSFIISCMPTIGMSRIFSLSVMYLAVVHLMSKPQTQGVPNIFTNTQDAMSLLVLVLWVRARAYAGTFSLDVEGGAQIIGLVKSAPLITDVLLS